MLQKNKRNLIDVLILMLIVLYLLTYFKPSLILSNTTLTGGDTGSHVFVADYMKNHLFNQGSLFKAAIGWTPDQYAGMPLVFYYFPLPYIITTLLSYLLPFNIAFKLTTTLGIFLLPVMVYVSMRLMKFKFPAPIFGAISSLLFLFLEGFSKWGGNILSVLAGQFSH